jgi:prolyl oligopeptidase
MTRRGDVVEDHFGIKVADPYRWLEDADSQETKDWVKAQNAVTFDYLRNIPEWKKIRSRLEELYTFERFGVPEIIGKRLAYTHNSGTQNQSVYFVSELNGDNARVLLGGC